MGPAGPETKNDFADEGQQQITRPVTGLIVRSQYSMGLSLRRQGNKNQVRGAKRLIAKDCERLSTVVDRRNKG
jgi:hypothetical protein